MKDTLVEMMSQFIDLTEEEKQGILEAFPVRQYSKGTDLIRQGQFTKDAFFVIKGCIRKYTLEDGEERTFDFFTEFQSAVNFESQSGAKPSSYYFTCIEDTVAGVINADKETKLYQQFPRFGEVCRVELEKMLGASQEQFLKFKNSTAEERYLNILAERPSLINRVPQYQLASYLGVKPESLSRIRKRIAVKP